MIVRETCYLGYRTCQILAAPIIPITFQKCINIEKFVVAECSLHHNICQRVEYFAAKEKKNGQNFLFSSEKCTPVVYFQYFLIPFSNVNLNSAIYRSKFEIPYFFLLLQTI